MRSAAAGEASSTLGGMIPLMGLTDKWLALAGRDGASEQELAQAERELGVQFPDDYRAVMLRCDGGGAGEGYAWDWRGKRDARCVVLPFISQEPDAAIPSGNNFEEFLAVLHDGIPFTRSRRAVEP